LQKSELILHQPQHGTGQFFHREPDSAASQGKAHNLIFRYKRADKAGCGKRPASYQQVILIDVSANDLLKIK
jgi:hypothetical protein